MELIRSQMTPLMTVWLVLLLFVSHVKSEGECKETSFQDIQDAAALSDAAYNKELVVGDSIPGAPDYIIQQVISYGSNGIFGIGLFGEPLKVIIAKKSSPATTMISFMGTKTAQQLLMELEKGLIHARIPMIVKGREVGIMDYFWKAFLAVRVDVEKIDLDPSMKYIVTGHSLGGALASVYALYMVDIKGGALWKNPESRLITFGAPRVGDQGYADLHDELIPPFRKPRFIFNRDVVPHVPTPIQGYHHASREMWIEKKTKMEKYMKKVGFIKVPAVRLVKFLVWHVCPNGDTSKCSNFGISINALDHGIKNYRDALQNLEGDNTKLSKFMKDQCK